MREERQPKARNSAVGYLIILVIAAFLLLALAFFMQQRTADSIEGLNQTVTTFQSMDQLTQENLELQELVETVRAERDTLQDQLHDLEVQLARTETELRATRNLLDLATATPAPTPAPEEEPAPAPSPAP